MNVRRQDGPQLAPTDSDPSSRRKIIQVDPRAEIKEVIMTHIALAGRVPIDGRLLEAGKDVRGQQIAENRQGPLEGETPATGAGRDGGIAVEDAKGHAAVSELLGQSEATDTSTGDQDGERSGRHVP